LSADPTFWDNPSRAQKVLKEKSSLERRVDSFLQLESTLEDIETLIEMAEEEQDHELRQEASDEMETLLEELKQVEIQRLLSEEADENDAIVEINSGAGGTEAADWASMLKRMYLGWGTKNGYKMTLLEESPHEEAGIKSCTIAFKGLFAYGYLKAESGVHRLVRISPYDSNARRHTSFASVSISPDVDDDFEIDIVESDLRIDTYRASGAGGQHVNTTDSAVRITHMPTGIVVQCQAERSQHKNKDRAMKMLKGKLYQAELDKRQEVATAAHAEKKKIEWGSQIRSYVLHPYKMIKDLRTNYDSSNVDKVMAGDLNVFMEKWLSMRADENAEQEQQ
jgi:peptide chain release factor 2